MSSFEPKLSLIALLGALSLIVMTPACTGFFVNQPTTITVNPSTASPAAGATQPFTALAAYSDNTTKDVTKSATWTSSNPCAVALIISGTNAGNATAVGTGGSVTITASLGGVTGTATATVPTGITITPCPTTAVGTIAKVIFNVGSTAQAFTATLSGSDVTSQATWTSSNSSVVNFASSSSSTATFPGAGTATITATTSTDTGTLLITVQ
jgi:hypothetical protein